MWILTAPGRRAVYVHALVISMRVIRQPLIAHTHTEAGKVN